MKTLKIYFLLMLLIQTISISAQSVISGKITNNDSSPIVGATILLSNGMDSTYITGTTSDLDGRFKMINVKSGNYFLSLSMIGYKKANIPLQIKESMNLELGDITLEEDSYIVYCKYNRQAPSNQGRTGKDDSQLIICPIEYGR